MVKENKHTDENIQFPEEMQNVLAQTKIEWEESKEDIWSKMEAKLGQTQAPVLKKVRPVFSLPRIVRYAAAAVIALLIGFTATAALYTKKITTGFTQEKSIVLPDNSKVNLYANSTLSYKPLMWKISRAAKLVGEAFFEVEKGKKFEVISEKAKTVVLGTKFIVKARNNEYDVDCEQGRVMVIEKYENNKAIITAGESVKLQANNTFKIISVNKIQNDSEPEIKRANSNEKVFDKGEPLRNTMFETKSNKKKIVPLPEQPVETNQNVANKGNESVQIGRITEKQEVDKIINEAGTMVQSIKQEKTPAQEPKNEVNNSTETAKKRFKNSLTKKQIEILEDKTLSKETKQRAFMKSLSAEQKELLRIQNKKSESNNNINAIKENAKSEQNGQMKNQMQNSVKNDIGNQVKGNGNGNGKGKN